MILYWNPFDKEVYKVYDNSAECQEYRYTDINKAIEKYNEL